MEKREGYKKTKVGLIPEHWDCIKLGRIGEFMKGKGIAKKDLIEDGIPCVRYGEIYTVHHWVLKDFHSFISSETALQSTKILKDDILFAGSGETVEEIGKAVAYLDDGEAYAGGDIIILRPGKVNSAFLSASLETEMSNKQKRKLGQGNSVVHIYPAGLKKLLVPLPPLPEQQKIASILTTVDDKISSIDQQIQQTEQLKKGLMEKLLTEGIGHTEFKDSKIGRIPKDWDIKTVETFFEFYNGYGFYKDGYSDKGIRVIDLLNITRDGEFHFTDKDKYISEELFNKRPKQKLKKDDLLIIMTDITPNKLLLGKSAILNAEGEYALNQRVGCLRSKDNSIYVPFVRFMLNSELVHKSFVANSLGTAQFYINTSTITMALLAIPPLKEQKQIASILSTVDNKIDILQSKKASYTSLKKGLMAQLLTGQMRVKI